MNLWGPSEHYCTCGNTALLKEMLQQWQIVGNTVSSLIGLRFEPHTCCFKDKSVTA